MNMPPESFSTESAQPSPAIPDLMTAVRIHERGGPEVLTVEQIATPRPGPGEVLIKVEAAGVNLADAGQRSGKYPNPIPLPLTLGYEVAGVVVAVGEGVSFPPRGMRVVAIVKGGYAQYAIGPAQTAIPLPTVVPFESGVAIPIQGMTAYLVLAIGARFTKGDSVLVSAAAGGVGSLAIQIAKEIGAGKVIGTSRKQSKLDLIRKLGADFAIDSSDPGWVEQAMSATDGRGVDIVVDAVGGQFGQQAIETLAPFGRMVSYGGLSGETIGFSTGQLIRKCLTVSGFNTQSQHPDNMLRAGRDLMGWLAEGKLQVIVEKAYPLEEAARAHAALEAGETTGKVVLSVS